MQQQQKEFMDRLESLTRPESVNVPAISPPKFKTFEKSKETWEQYMKRFEQHLKLHNVVEIDRKRAFLLTWLLFFP